MIIPGCYDNWRVRRVRLRAVEDFPAKIDKFQVALLSGGRLRRFRGEGYGVQTRLGRGLRQDPCQRPWPTEIQQAMSRLRVRRRSDEIRHSFAACRRAGDPGADPPSC